MFRFGNGIFEPVWNRRYIDHVEITVAESLGVERRGGYYEHAGALRDMIPNHLLQLVSLTAMEPPVSFQADAVRDEQSKVLHAIQPMQPEDVLTRAVRGQYSEGAIDGQSVPAYRSEQFVDAAFERRNVCGAEAPARQLALGRRAVLYPHRQAAAEARTRKSSSSSAARRLSCSAIRRSTS